MRMNTYHHRQSISRKEEAQRALELLEEYHAKLSRPSDRPLRTAVERVIKIFQSNLFQALLDIQKFYEFSCLDEGNALNFNPMLVNSSSFPKPPDFADSDRKLAELQQQQQSPITQTREEQHKQQPVYFHQSPPATVQPVHPIESYPPTQPLTADADYVQGYAVQGYAPNVMPQPPPPVVPPEALDNNYISDEEEEWEELTVVLHKGRQGLGFSIAGGVDNPHIGDDPHIYITKIIEGGAAEQETTLRMNDILLSVNDISTENVKHMQAVEILKQAGQVVRMRIRRQRLAVAEKIIEIELIKGDRGLGFSIAGGIGNNHHPGDCGIFVTKIIPGGAAEHESQLEVGDRIIAVRSWDRKNPNATMFDKNLENVYHEEAVATFKATHEFVLLVVAKPARIPVENLNMAPEAYSSPPGSYPHGSPIKSHYATSPPIEPSLPQTMSNHSGFNSLPRSQSNSLPRTPLQTNYNPPAYDSSPRPVLLMRGQTGLGFNIVGGEDEDTNGIFVSFILPGGVADISGELRKGDQLISVNGTNLVNATHEQAATALKNAGQKVFLEVCYKPDDYAKFEAKIRDLREQMISSNASGGTLKTIAKKSFYVRALFDYDCRRDSGVPGQGLSFNHGDILHVQNASDDEWWSASHILPNGTEEGYGIVPSKRRIERKERSRMKSVKFQHQSSGDSLERKSNSGTLEKKKKFFKKFALSKSKESDLDTCDQDQNYTSNASDSEGSNRGQDDIILSYEPVVLVEIDYHRPVVILGPSKDRINDDLLSDYPDQFGSCVPHTTRPKRNYEVDGRDYHFVESKAEMEADIAAHKFIEAGQYHDNLYGTSILSVKDVCRQNKHCILDVSGNAIRRLIQASLYPIAIFLKPRSTESIQEMNKRLPDIQAQKMFERAQKTETEFAEYFTAIVQGDTIDELYSKVRQVISNNAGPKIWVPSKERL